MRIRTQKEAEEKINEHKDIEKFEVGKYFTIKPKGRLIHKIKLKCKVCGTVIEKNCFETPTHLNCPDCRKREITEAKKLRLELFERETQEDIVQGIIDSKRKYNDFYDYSGFKPNKFHERGTIICKKHGKFKQNIETHLNYFGCRDCLLEELALPHNKTNEQMIFMMKYIHKNALDFSKFIATRAAENSWVHCNKCGNDFETDFNHLTATTLTGCHPCGKKKAGLKKRLSQEQAMKDLNGKYRGVLDFTNFVYLASKKESEVYCTKCKTTFPSSHDTLMSPEMVGGCDTCLGKNRTQEEAIYNLITMADEKLDFSEFRYTDSTGKSWVTCTNCTHRWEASYTLLTRGRSCPCCKQSAGEAKIKEILGEIGEEYKEQETFEGCKNIIRLPFDFYLEKYDLLIEYQGEQHYKYTEFFHRTPEGFALQKKKDKIKKDYAEKHHNFLAIPYWDFNNIETILKETLDKLPITC